MVPFLHVSSRCVQGLCLSILHFAFTCYPQTHDVSPCTRYTQTLLLCFISYQAFASVPLVTGTSVSVIFLSSSGMFVSNCGINVDT